MQIYVADVNRNEFFIIYGRALEARRKNYEEEEERIRQKILAQRKKEIQEATEKFQRSNVIRSGKRTVRQTRTMPASKTSFKHPYNRTLSSAKSPDMVNKKPYYPSVEEVMTLINADREKLDMKVSRIPDSESHVLHEEAMQEKVDVEAHEHEKLRSEVVGRVEPKIAFESEDITAGVLPTTIQDGSRSESLSSLDSLDVLPDKELEQFPESTNTPRCTSTPRSTSTSVGIIRQGSNKTRQATRVTFKEHVEYSDGMVGNLKGLQRSEMLSDPSLIPNKMSYFGLPNGNTEENDIQLLVKGDGLGSSKDSLILNRYLSNTTYDTMIHPQTVSTQMNSSHNKLGVGVATDKYSGSKTSKQNTNVTPVLPDTRGGNNDTQEYTKVPRDDISRTMNQDCDGNLRNEIVQDADVSNLKVVMSLQGNEYGSVPVTAVVAGSQDATPSSFSSLNVSMLKDSLEMHNDVMKSTGKEIKSSKITVGNRDTKTTSSLQNGNAEGEIFNDLSRQFDIKPDVPLVPVTKTDFLSKALRSSCRQEESNRTNVLFDDLRNRDKYESSNEYETARNDRESYAHENNYERIIISPQNSENYYQKISIPVQNAGNNNQRIGVSPQNGENQHQRIGFPAQNGKMYDENKWFVDRKQVQSGQSYASSHEEKSMKINGGLPPRPTANSKQTMTESRSRQHMRQHSTVRVMANRKAAHKSLSSNERKNFALRKPDAADELLKSVQEDIERLKMIPLQPNAVVKTISTTKAALSSNGEYERNSSSETTGSQHQVRKRVENKRNDGVSIKRFHASDSDTMMENARSRSNITNVNESRHRSGNWIDDESDLASRMPQHNYVNKRNSNANCTVGAEPSYVGTQKQDISSNIRSSRFDKKQRMNSEGLRFLDKTPTDEEINNLWETVRTCLKHEQPQKAASDSVVNNVRYSRSENGSLVGNHYLIENQAWGVKSKDVSDNDSQNSRRSLNASFHRQGSLDNFQRRGSDRYTPPKKASLLHYRSNTNERKLSARTLHVGRPPINSQQQYLRTLPSPSRSSRGPMKSSSKKTDETAQLSFAEFQAVMHASADIKNRNVDSGHQMNVRQNIHQPVILTHRKGNIITAVFITAFYHFRCLAFASPL